MRGGYDVGYIQPRTRVDISHVSLALHVWAEYYYIAVTDPVVSGILVDRSNNTRGVHIFSRVSGASFKRLLVSVTCLHDPLCY